MWFEPALSASADINIFTSRLFLLQEAVIKLLDEICHILPSTYRGQCEAIIGKFTKPVLEAIISYATPEAICALIHLCKGQEALVVGQSSFSYFNFIFGGGCSEAVRLSRPQP